MDPLGFVDAVRVELISPELDHCSNGDADHRDQQHRTVATPLKQALNMKTARCRQELIEFAKAVSDFAAVEVDGKLALLHVDARHDAEVTVVTSLS